MTNPLLQSLRESVLDESEPLAGLLRKCLLLGAATGSDVLRQWARYELNGYDKDVEVPGYRQLDTPLILVDSMSGNRWAQGVSYHRLEIPEEARKGVPESFDLRLPVEEIAGLAAKSSVKFSNAGLAYARSLWNQGLGPFEQVVGMNYTMSGSVLEGVLGQVRTRLVDVVAELTADTPLEELPKKDAVDAAVRSIGVQYNTTIHDPQGPIAVGSKAQVSTAGLSVEDVMTLLADVRDAAGQAVGDDKSSLLKAVDELQTAVEQDAPDTGEIVKRAGRLQSVGERLGVPTLSAAVGGAVNAVVSLAVRGSFG